MAFSFERPNEEWTSVSRAALIGWCIFYGLFLLNAILDKDGFLFLDHANLVFHEIGHPAFGIFEVHWLMILGGTLVQHLVPLGITAYFWWMRQTTGAVFSAFWFFENFLYTASYMADARALLLPLVNAQDIGDHDWNFLFSWWGVIMHDRKIAGYTRAVGWLGMLATVACLAWRHFRQEEKPHYTSQHAPGRGPLDYGGNR